MFKKLQDDRASHRNRSRTRATRYRPVAEPLEAKILLANFICINSGDWNSPSTWKGSYINDIGKVPGSHDLAGIGSGFSVEVSDAEAVGEVFVTGALTVSGTLVTPEFVVEGYRAVGGAVTVSGTLSAAYILSTDPADTFANSGRFQTTGGDIEGAFVQTSTGSTQVSSGGTLSLVGSATISGSITGPGGFAGPYPNLHDPYASLDVPGSLTISGTRICVLRSAITGGGTITVEGTNLTGAATFDGTNLDISGAVSLSEIDPFTFVDGATLDNLSGAIATIVDPYNDTYVEGDSTSSFENNGTINVLSGAQPHIQMAFHQSATGSVQANGDIALQSGGTITGSLNAATGGTLEFDSGTYNLDDSSSITGSGNVELANATVNDAGSYDISGTTTIGAGSELKFTGGKWNSSGDVSNDGTLSLAPGGLDVTGNYTQTGTGTLQIGIAGLSPGLQYGQLNVSGQANVAGSVVINLLNGFVPQTGDSFEVLTSSTTTGGFDTPAPLVFDLGDGNRLNGGWDGGNFWLDDGFVVTNVDDTGHGSLRYVIGLVNVDPADYGHDDVTFDSSTAGPDAINLESSLPELSRDDVTITGLSTTRISGPPAGNALSIAGDDDAIATITIEYAGPANGGIGILIKGNDNAITETVIKFCGIGISIVNGATDNTIGGTIDVGNMITSSQGDGIDIEGDGNLVAGNQIGGDGFGNGGDGILIGGGATDNQIGGAPGGNTGDSQTNVISNNAGNGVEITGDETAGNVVSENFIGVNSFGLGAEPNSGDGILIADGASMNSVIGNVSSSNHGAGVELSRSSQTLVVSNKIGTDIAITASAPNLAGGVLIDDGASENTISGNIIAGNVSSAGVEITGSGTDDNQVQANAIGVVSAGPTYLGNRSGVAIENGASDNTIGGTTSGAGNTIAYSSGAGVIIGQNATDANTGDAVLGNAIFSNGKLGIDLGNNGVTLNGSGGHAGPNLFQDFPVLTSAVSGPSSTTITGTVHGPANSILRVELFTNPKPDSSGYGQGQTFLGAVIGGALTDANGNGTFRFTTSQSLAQGLAISATATDANNNTSEFSLDLPVVVDVTSQISYKRSGLVYNRFTGIYAGTITLTNTGKDMLGPIQLVLTGLTPGLTLINAGGTNWRGSPYITVNGPLAFNGSITITLQFRKSAPGLYVDYDPIFYVGTLIF